MARRRNTQPSSLQTEAPILRLSCQPMFVFMRFHGISSWLYWPTVQFYVQAASSPKEKYLHTKKIHETDKVHYGNNDKPCSPRALCATI